MLVVYTRIKSVFVLSNMLKRACVSYESANAALVLSKVLTQQKRGWSLFAHPQLCCLHEKSLRLISTHSLNSGFHGFTVQNVILPRRD